MTENIKIEVTAEELRIMRYALTHLGAYYGKCSDTETDEAYAKEYYDQRREVINLRKKIKDQVKAQ